MLVHLGTPVLEWLYRDPRASWSGDRLDVGQFDQLLRALEEVRRNGYALNVGETEDGVAALGVSLVGTSGRPIAAMSVAVPTSRFGLRMRQGLAQMVMRTRVDLDAGLARQGVEVAGGS